VTGVAFFDFEHGQTGVAPNAIELHPILGFRCLSGSVVNGPGAAAPAPPARGSHTGRVKLSSLTSPVDAGSDATLVVAVPNGTTCSIVVTYKSGPSEAAGLYPQSASSGQIMWTWMVGTRTTPGQWPIDVSCGAAGSLHTSFVVT
jgi:micrococcal nuclease